MKQIAENIIIETEYTGVTLGAVIQPDRIIYIDAPLLPEHARLWRNAATGRKKLPQQVILMDANHDRTIGSRYLECTIIAQERTHWIYQNRPVTFKPISQNSGCEWERIRIQNGFRWIYPEIVFSQRMDLHQSELHIDLQYHPGPSAGSTWVEVPARNVIFVGDTVVSGQVPFLHTAEIGPWLQALDELEQAAGLEEQERKERIRQTGKRFLDTSKAIWHYYRERYELDKPPPAYLLRAKKLWELREQGLEPGEICKRAGIKRVAYCYLIAEWQRWMKLERKE